jgi:hypothetical protein
MTHPMILLLLRIRCHGNVFTKPLSRTIGRIHIQTDMEGFMKCAVEMGSVAITYIQSFVKIGSCIHKLIEEGIHRHTGRMEITLT